MESWQEIILLWRIAAAKIQIFALRPDWREEAFNLLKDNLESPGVLKALHEQLQREPTDSPIYEEMYNIIQQAAA